MTVIQPLPCGCKPTDTDPKNPLEGTLQNPFTVKLCPLHSSAQDLLEGLTELMTLIESADCGISASTWKDLQDVIQRAKGNLRCCGCHEWCTEKNPAYDYNDDTDFALKCADKFGLVHMVDWPPWHFEEGGAVLCVTCVNTVQELCPKCHGRHGDLCKNRWKRVGPTEFSKWSVGRTITDDWDPPPPDFVAPIVIHRFTDRTAIALSMEPYPPMFWLYKETE